MSSKQITLPEDEPLKGHNKNTKAVAQMKMAVRSLIVEILNEVPVLEVLPTYFDAKENPDYSENLYSSAIKKTCTHNSVKCCCIVQQTQYVLVAIMHGICRNQINCFETAVIKHSDTTSHNPRYV